MVVKPSALLYHVCKLVCQFAIFVYICKQNKQRENTMENTAKRKKMKTRKSPNKAKPNPTEEEIILVKPSEYVPKRPEKARRKTPIKIPFIPGYKENVPNPYNL